MHQTRDLCRPARREVFLFASDLALYRWPSTHSVTVAINSSKSKGFRITRKTRVPSNLRKSLVAAAVRTITQRLKFLRRRTLQMFDDLEAVNFRHHQVEDDRVEFSICDDADCLVPVLCCLNREAFSREYGLY